MKGLEHVEIGNFVGVHKINLVEYKPSLWTDIFDHKVAVDTEIIRAIQKGAFYLYILDQYDGDRSRFTYMPSVNKARNLSDLTIEIDLKIVVDQINRMNVHIMNRDPELVALEISSITAGWICDED